MRRKFISKTKRREAERDTQDCQQKEWALYTRPAAASLLRGPVQNKTMDKDAALAFRPTDAEEKNK